MLNTLRQHTGGLIAKILIALLVLSFGVWGVGDVLRSHGMKNEVAKVDGHPVSIQAFQREYKNAEDDLRQRLGADYTPELARALGLPKQVLNRLIERQLLLAESRTLGLIPSDEAVARAIRKNTIFFNEKNVFDKSRFVESLRRNNLSEAAYIDILRDQMGIQLLIETVTAAPVLPESEVATIAGMRAEKRVAEIYQLPLSLVHDGPNPDDAALEAYYKAHAQEFTVPELRRFSYVSFTSGNVKDAKPTDAEIERAYQERREEFTRPERRKVEQMLFSAKAKADAASAMLKEGKPFADVAAKAGALNKTNLSLGAIGKESLPESAKEAVWALKAEEASAPIKDDFGWHIYRVTGTLPGGVLPLAEVRAQIEKDLQEQGSGSALSQLANKLEDMLAGGGTLEEAAKSLGLSVKHLGPVDRQGNQPNGQPAKDLPEAPEFLANAFKTDAGNDSSVFMGEGGTYYLVHMDEVTPEQPKPLAQVKEEVTAGWKKEQKLERLQKLANDTAAAMNDPAKRVEALKKLGVNPFSSGPLKRGETKAANGTPLPPALVDELFTLTPGQSSKPVAAVGNSMMIAVLKERIKAPANADGKDIAGFRQTLEEMSRQELLREYIDYLHDKHPVSIDAEAVALASGANREP